MSFRALLIVNIWKVEVRVSLSVCPFAPHPDSCLSYSCSSRLSCQQYCTVQLVGVLDGKKIKKMKRGRSFLYIPISSPYTFPHQMSYTIFLHYLCIHVQILLLSCEYFSTFRRWRLMMTTGCIITAPSSRPISLLIYWPPPVNMNVTYILCIYNHRILTHITSSLMVPTCKR